MGWDRNAGSGVLSLSGESTPRIGFRVQAAVVMSRKPKPPEAAIKQKRSPEKAFDTWLRRGLHEIFDDVAREPIPEELLKLIEEHREK